MIEPALEPKAILLVVITIDDTVKTALYAPSELTLSVLTAKELKVNAAAANVLTFNDCIFAEPVEI